jgi:hypothetical protein
MVNKQFLPSKTAQNGLNFVTKEEEHSLANKDQPDEIINIFKLVYLYLNEPLEGQTELTIIAHLINELLPKYHAENLSKLLLTHRIAFCKPYIETC